MVKYNSQKGRRAMSLYLLIYALNTKGILMQFERKSSQKLLMCYTERKYADV